MPIVKGKLAIRLATNIEDSEGNQVFSVNNTAKPFVNDRSYRATLLFKPTDTISIEAMYQTRRTSSLQYDQVVGSGSPGAPAPSATLCTYGLGLCAIPANYNGPALTLRQRGSVEEIGNINTQHIDLATINANWEVLGHNLSYNYGRQIDLQPDVL